MKEKEHKRKERDPRQDALLPLVRYRGSKHKFLEITMKFASVIDGGGSWLI
jgi:hypothetical protein